MANHHFKSFIIFVLYCSLFASTTIAAPPNTPPGLSLENLPPGRTAEKIQSLPAAAQRQALQWLDKFSIPKNDYDSIEIDPGGGVFYVEPPVKDLRPATVQTEAATDQTTTSEPTISAADAFGLHSKPGAAHIILLEFNGSTISNTAWNASSGVARYDAMPFDLDNNPYSFSQSELAAIAAIWHRVAEDYAAFDVDVTTEHPGQIGLGTGTILVTRSTDANGQWMPHGATAGGVAYVGVWGISNYAYYQPALVYYDHLGRVPSYIAEAATHEMGHNLGLSHDGTLSGQAYYYGHGSGNTDWAPSMGVAYYSHVSQWSNGSYQDANNQQDDIAIIRSRLTGRSDDHGDDIFSASLLVADDTGKVSATNPETDPDNSYTDNKGIVETSSDVDVFQLTVLSGQIDLTIFPAWDAYNTPGYRGANLDIEARLLDGQGNTLALSNPLDDTDARILVGVSSGTYYLSVTGVGRGSALTTYDDYGSQGMYFIRGTLPSFPRWNTGPYGNNEDRSQILSIPDANALTVTVTGGTEASHDFMILYDQYNNEVARFSGVINETLVITGSSIRARLLTDGSGTGPGVVVSIAPTTITVPAPSELTAKAVSSQKVNLSWRDNSSNESGFRIERQIGTGAWSLISIVGTDATTYAVSGLTVSTNYSYRVLAFNEASHSAYSNIANVYTCAAPLIIGIGTSVNGSLASTDCTSELRPDAFSDSYTFTATAGEAFTIDLRSSFDTYLYLQSDNQVIAQNNDVDGTTNSRIIYTPTISGNLSIQATSLGVGVTGVYTLSLVAGKIGTIPAAPSTLTASVASTSQINLSWRDNSTKEAGFHIERQIGTGSWSQIAQVGSNVTSFASAGLTSNTTYSYRVRAYNGLGESAYSNTVTAVTKTDTIPRAPSTLVASVASTSQINLSWIDNSSLESGFHIERQIGTGAWSQIATVGPNVSGFANTGLTSQTSYGYRVRAYNGAGTSAYSNTVTAVTKTDTIPRAPSTLVASVASTSQINLNWSDNSSLESGFHIERQIGTGAWSQIATVGPNVTSFANTGLTSQTSYGYRVRAYNGAGTSAYSNTVTAKTTVAVPAAPSTLTASVASTSQINLSWRDNSSNESGFKIERRIGTGAWSQIATVGSNATSFASTGLKTQTSYGYRVRAYNGIGTSAYSNVVSAKTR